MTPGQHCPPWLGQRRPPPTNPPSETARAPVVARRSVESGAVAWVSGRLGLPPGHRDARGPQPVMVSRPGPRPACPARPANSAPARRPRGPGFGIGAGRGPCRVARRVERTTRGPVSSARATPSACRRPGPRAWAGVSRWGSPPGAEAASHRPPGARGTRSRRAPGRRVRACRGWRSESAGQRWCVGASRAAFRRCRSAAGVAWRGGRGRCMALCPSRAEKEPMAAPRAIFRLV